MGPLTSADYKRIFEESAVTPFDTAHEAHWIWLMKEVLDLPLSHLEAVHETLKQGRWRKADDPKPYIKTVAKREAARMEITNYPGEHLHFLVPAICDEEGRQLSHDDYIDYRSYNGPVREGGIWKSRNPDFYREEEHGEEGELLTRRERLLKKVPEELKATEELPEEIKDILEEINSQLKDHHLSTDPVIALLWHKVAVKAGLDEAETRVLAYRLQGVSRDCACEMQSSDEERRKIQAAWKRFQRTGLAKMLKVFEEKVKKSD